MKKQDADAGTVRLKVQCIRNDGYAGSLIVGHVYEAFHGQMGVLGVIDEEGESYIYPDECFEIIDS
ncbi:MAG: hypothetical protein ACI4MK_12770 [Aristaeellaceae bacterium]